MKEKYKKEKSRKTYFIVGAQRRKRGEKYMITRD